jgi:sporulation protein YlmC with PRC-barrel domain
MKTTLSLLTVIGVAAHLALPLRAEEHKDKDKERAKDYPAESRDRIKDATTDATRPYSTQPEAFGVVTKAKGVIGMEVRNNQNDKLGKVDDVAMSFSSGRVVAVIISVGGLLGVGDTLIAVPPSEFHADADGKTLHLNRTKDELKNAPRLDVAKWEEFQKPANLAEVYRYYGVRPYFREETVSTPDPKFRNRIDTPTALQQGNSEGDLNTTARIRKDLLKRKDLSTSAHNVTVITRDGQVTLRGTVDSEDEKRIVAEIAKSAATPSNVDNQLDVSRTTNK